MDYEKLMNQAMTYIQLQMKTYEILAKTARVLNDEEEATRYSNMYIAIRDTKVGIDKLALQMKNGE